MNTYTDYFGAYLPWIVYIHVSYLPIPVAIMSKHFQRHDKFREHDDYISGILFWIYVSIDLFIYLSINFISLFQSALYDYATEIGIDPDNEQELMYLAMKGFNAPLPPEWRIRYGNPKPNMLWRIYYPILNPKLFANQTRQLFICLYISTVPRVILTNNKLTRTTETFVMRLNGQWASHWPGLMEPFSLFFAPAGRRTRENPPISTSTQKRSAWITLIMTSSPGRWSRNASV